MAATKQQPERSADDALAEISAALKVVLRAGLPLQPKAVPEVLFNLPGVIARSVRPDDPLASVDALDRLVRTLLKRLEPPERRDAAELLFLVSRGGRTLTQRRLAAAASLDYEVHHFRKRIEPKLIEELAWRLHKDSLQYVRRRHDGKPFEASGDTPTITEEQVSEPEMAGREILISRIWSDVYGLRAELIAREASRSDPDHLGEFQEAANGAFWYLARLLTNLSAYTDKYGKAILHGNAEYNAEALIRLAGWTGELTPEQTRELRFALARAGQWDRAGFIAAQRKSS
jgi:hypothetical protein